MATVSRRWAAAKGWLFQLEWLKLGFWLLGLTLAALHGWAAIRSESMNADGIAYLDIGDAYMRGDWQSAINPVWSPLYSWVLGAVMVLVQPGMTHEFAAVHVVNLALFALALLSFEFFWRQLDHYRKQIIAPTTHTWPDWAWWAGGYSLFIWMALAQINIWAVTPDMLMAALVLLAAGLIARLRTGEGGRLSSILLGFVLGFSYLAKTIMFPLAFVFLAAALFAARNLRRTVPRTGLALASFLLVSLPFVVAISLNHGRLTIGESGTVTYLRHVQGVASPPWWSEDSNLGDTTAQVRQVFENPPIYEFAEPVGGTYPVTYNPIYWYEGIHAPFDIRRQAQALLTNGLFFFDLFARQLAVLPVVVILLYLSAARRRKSVDRVIERWGLLLPALAALALYALVYVEGRYVGVFILLFWSDLLANVHVPDSAVHRRIIGAAGLLIVSFLLLNIASFNLEGYGRLEETGAPSFSSPPARPVETAMALREMGVGPGSAVGVIGYPYDSFWARLARVRIIAELPDWQADPFWLGDAALQQDALQAFASTGVCAVVAEYAPRHASLPGWRQVGISNYYIYLLQEGC